MAADVPCLDAAYKLVEYDGRPMMKPSSAKMKMKMTDPGRKQVFRRAGRPDLIALAGERSPSSARPLLRTVMRGGRRTSSPDTWQDARGRFREDLAGVPARSRRVKGPEPVAPVRPQGFQRLTASVRAAIEARLHAAPAGTPVG
ncbi:hypothetical protein ACF1GW_13735 [Streptomyces achromogenes]|uniref:hypothetical protein n=1 Tax=Streptomyces achromogenes TaxID=67255 RepID=UPI003702EECA